jgi:Cu-Zn family superoxide dismutase
MNRLIKLAVPAIAVPAIAVAAVLSFGCNRLKADDGAKKMAAEAGKVAVANVQPAKAASTQPAWGKSTGTVTFTQLEGDKVKVAVDLQGVPPGTHGFHVHDKADLSAADLTSAGAHFNPGGHKHGGPDSKERHAGDLGNVEADTSGNVKKEMTVAGLSVGTGAANDVIGHSVILHAKADDLKTDPSGNSGGRIAGGVIELKK